MVFHNHAVGLVTGEQLRAEATAYGTALPKGFHAQKDSYGLRKRVYEGISRLSPRIDATFLRKSNANDYIRAIAQVCNPGDRLFVIVATLGTNRRKAEFEDALHDVCVKQAPSDRQVVLCHWNCETSWGLQTADYALWALQRSAEKNQDDFMPYIEPHLRSWSFPWLR